MTEQEKDRMNYPEPQVVLSDGQEAAALYRLGSKHFESGDWEAARDAFLAALEMNPGKAQLHYRLGCAYGKLHDWPAAERSLVASAALDPMKGEVFFNLGQALQKQRKTVEAKNAYLSALPLYALKAKSGDTSVFFRWSVLLLECGFPYDALRVATETAKLLGPCPKVENLMRIVSKNLGDLGDIEAGLAGWESLRALDGFDEMIFRNYLVLSRTFAFFDDKALAAARKALSKECSDPIAKEAAIDLLFLFYGPSEELLEQAIGLISSIVSPSHKMLLSLASMLFSQGEEQRLNDLYLSYPELKAYCGEAPAISYAFLNLTPPDNCPEAIALATETMAAYESVKNAEKEVWARIGDPSLSLAIIGNSGREIGRKRGKEIDAHDVIIRFNNFSVSPPFDVDYGQKVDVVVRIAKDEPKYNGYSHNRDIILSGLRFLNNYTNWSLVRRLIAQGCRVAVFPTEFQEQLINILRRSPSAGLTVSWIAAKLRPGSSNVSHYGFSFLDQIGKNPASAHYFEQVRPTGRHAWSAEAEVFQKITGISVSPGMPLEEGEGGQRIRLVGDHSEYHSGCHAVVSYLQALLRPAGAFTEGDDYSVLVVNGEGSMHHDSPGFRSKMEELCKAIGRGKKAYLVNTVWQANSKKYDHILKHLDGIVVREQASHDDLLENHGVESLIRLDVSYWAEIDATATFLDLNGQIAAGDFYSKEFDNFVRLTGGPLKKYPFVDMSGTGWSSLVRTLRTASLLVTGRHHAVFAACRARIPFVALQGNTHKIEGMVKMSRLPVPVCSSPQELPEMIKWALSNKSLYEEFFSWMDEQPRFDLEDLHFNSPAECRFEHPPLA